MAHKISDAAHERVFEPGNMDSVPIVTLQVNTSRTCSHRSGSPNQNSTPDIARSRSKEPTPFPSQQRGHIHLNSIPWHKQDLCPRYGKVVGVSILEVLAIHRAVKESSRTLHCR